MRSTNEIIIAVKENQPVTKEELRLALLVTVSNEHFLQNDLHKLIEAVMEDKASAKLQAKFAEGTLKTLFQAVKKDPALYLESHNIPGNPEHDKRYRTGLKILNKFLASKEKP